MVDNLSLTRRTVTSAIIITLVSLVIFLFPNWVFALLASAMIGLALKEFFSLAEKKGIIVYKYFGISIGMLIIGIRWRRNYRAPLAIPLPMYFICNWIRYALAG